MMRIAKERSLFALLAIVWLPGTTGAQAPDTFDDPVPLAESGLTRAKVLQAFEQLAYGANPEQDTPGRLTRWEEDEIGVLWRGTLGSNGIRAERGW